MTSGFTQHVTEGAPARAVTDSEGDADLVTIILWRIS